MYTATLARPTYLSTEQKTLITDSVQAFWNHEDFYTPSEVIRILDDPSIQPADKHAAVLNKLRMTRGDRNGTANFSRVIMVMAGYGEFIDADMIVP